MGLLVKGEWVDKWYDTDSTGGKFEREESVYRNWVTRDGSAGPTGEGGFKAEAGRYHLYVSLACPWAHRTLIFRVLKGLEEVISVSVVNPLMLEHGWTFEGNAADSLYGSQYLHQLYTKADKDFTGRVTVPMLWDKQRETIVSNESSEIIRMLNTAFNELAGNSVDFYPKELREEIDRLNEVIYPSINNGVYRTGFATTQQAYEEAFQELFSALDNIEERLASRRYLTGERITEADWRLFTTLVRFDAVYYGHFKTNRQRIADYPNLSGYLRDLYQVPGVASTVNMTHIKQHYYGSHKNINPTGIVPLGPEQDFNRPHGREKLATV